MFTDQLIAIASITHEVIIGFLIFLSICSIAIIMDRILFFNKFISQTSLILSDMIEALENGRNSHMKLVYNKYAFLSAGKFLQKSWEHIIKKRERGLEEMMNAQLFSMKIKAEKYLSFLATIGFNAPLIGLLGTIFGVIEVFDALGTQGGSMSMVMVMMGISKSLISTAVGLIVAIPSITAYIFLQRKIKITFLNLESMKEALLSFVKNCNK